MFVLQRPEEPLDYAVGPRPARRSQIQAQESVRCRERWYSEAASGWWAVQCGNLHDRLIAVRQQRDLPVVSVYHH
jgi:hypothetical protein